MSSVRMCDRCGTIFKEGAEGSAVGSVTVMVREGNHTYPQQQSQDICPDCGAGNSPTPKLAIEGPTYSQEEIDRRYKQDFDPERSRRYKVYEDAKRTVQDYEQEL